MGRCAVTTARKYASNCIRHVLVADIPAEAQPARQKYKRKKRCVDIQNENGITQHSVIYSSQTIQNLIKRNKIKSCLILPVL